ncbi:MAG: Haloacid dehalogenase domain protein hydrolase [Subtercola sp.]|nr:Haloacid dehalogenase domain protein hydrolase [Subtercola sp.]
MTTSKPARQIIFDLDGTLVQTRVASWAVFQEVNAEFDLGIDDETKYFALLNGNLFERIRQLCRSKAQADAVIESFMGKLGNDYFPTMIPGMVDVVHALAPVSTLAVLSSNLTSVIRRVLVENGIEFCFAHVFGGDVEPDKADGIRRFVADAAQGAGRRCSPFYDEASAPRSLAGGQTVLVTDTAGDVEAATAAGVRAVGVSWGMHSAAQLTAAGAEFVAFWPQELVSYLKSPSDESEASASCSTAQPARTFTPSELSASIRRNRRLVSTGQQPLRVPTIALLPSPGGSCGCDVVAATSAADSASAPAGSVRPNPAFSRTSEDLLEAVTRILS